MPEATAMPASRKSCESLSAYLRIRISHGSNHAANTGGNNGVRARSGTALVRARLQIDVEGRAAGLLASLFEGNDFSVLHAIISVRATAKHGALIINNDSANARVR